MCQNGKPASNSYFYCACMLILVFVTGDTFSVKNFPD